MYAREIASRRWSAAVVLPALVVVACGGRTYLTPAIAGVVVEIGGTNSAVRYQLANGQEYTIDITNAAVVAYGGGPPDVGDLLLGGTGPDGPWVARLYSDASIGGNEPDCYLLDGDGTDRGAWIETDAGFRLPKAPGFDPGASTVGEGERFTNALSPAFCVNPDGQLTSFG